MIIGDNNCRRHGGVRILDTFLLALRRAPTTISVTCLAFLIQTIAVCAQSPAVTLTGPVGVEEWRGHVEALLDPDWSLSVSNVTSPDISEHFAPVTGRSPDFGYTASAIWLRFSVVNISPSIGEWRLLFRDNFLPIFEVYQTESDGMVTVLTQLAKDSPFAARPLGSPTLAVPFELPKGGSTTFYIRYASGGSSQVSWSIESEDSFNALSERTTAKNFIYYGMMLILIIIALFAFMLLWKGIFISYVGYTGSALLFLMHADGNGFKFLWPNLPHFNNYASVALGSGIILFGASYAMIFLQTRRNHPVIDKLLGGVILLTLGMLVASAFVDNQPIKKMLVLLAFAAICIFVISGFVAARFGFKKVRFYILAWTGAAIASAIMTGRHWLGLEISEEVQFDSMRIVMVWDAGLMGLAIWDRFNQLRKARQAALEDSLSKSIHNLALNRRLQDLEVQFAVARELADRKGRQFADTIHDLAQPLHALRLDLGRFTDDPSADPKRLSGIEGTLIYLEELIADHLAGAVEQVSAAQEIDDAETTEQLGVGEVLRAIHEMFVSDARDKGLRFRYVDTSLQAQITPLVLMRIVTNLVANAIKYTERGSILLGCRRQGEMLRVEVHDTGPGMTHDDFDRASSRAVRLEKDDPAAEGYGLGLSIARSLAETHGLALTIAPNRTHGAGLMLTIPRRPFLKSKRDGLTET